MKSLLNSEYQPIAATKDSQGSKGLRFNQISNRGEILTLLMESILVTGVRSIFRWPTVSPTNSRGSQEGGSVYPSPFAAHSEEHCNQWSQYLLMQNQDKATEIAKLKHAISVSQREVDQTRQQLIKDISGENYELRAYCVNLSQQLEAAGDYIRKLELRLSTLEPLQEGCGQVEAICGSYGDESPTPGLLSNVLSSTKTAVIRFQKSLAQALQSKYGLPMTLHFSDPELFFARPTHVEYAMKAVLYEVFFCGFENESFNIHSGVTKFLDPAVRQARFYKLYLYEREHHDSRDGQTLEFDEFWNMKLVSMMNKLNLRSEFNREGMNNLSCLEDLGGPDLAADFLAAAKCFWLLHRLAFSFEPSAAIFRVERGADIDPEYMDPVVSLEDHERFVPKVGFMIAPGLRLRKSVLRSEVYLSGSENAD